MLICLGLFSLEMTTAYLVFLAIIALTLFITFYYSSRGFVEKFTSRTIIRGDELVFSEPLKVELGLIEVRYSTNAYLTDFKVVNQLRVETASAISLNELCNTGFFIALFKSKVAPFYYVLAPGFRVLDGRYKGVTGLCLDPSKVPEKTISLTDLGGWHRVVGEVRLLRSGSTGRVYWAPSMLSRPAYSKVKLEVCTSNNLSRICVRLAEVSIPGEEAFGRLNGLIERKVIFIFDNAPFLIVDRIVDRLE